MRPAVERRLRDPHRVSARWPENTPDTPVTLELEPEGKPTVSATRWSFGPSLNDSYSFSWK